MNNQLTQSGHDVSQDRGHTVPAESVVARNRDALEAFVHEAKNGNYEDDDTLGAAVEVIQQLIDGEPSTTTAAAVPTTQPAVTKWADAVDYDGSAVDDEPDLASHPIDQVALPEAVSPAAARAAYDAVVEFLIAHGPATGEEIVCGVMADHSLGYEPPAAADPEADRWWLAVIKPALGADDTVRYRSGYGYEVGSRPV